METINEKLAALKSTKSELTDELRNLPLDDFLKKCENSKIVISKADIDILKTMGINTLGDLLQVDTIILNNKLSMDFSLNKYEDIRFKIMGMGLLFNDDHVRYEQLGISDEVALIPIRNLNLSNRVVHSLIRFGKIFYLGDLLSKSYNVLSSIWSIGKEGLSEIKEYVHSLGYSLVDEKKEIDEIQKEYEQKGIPMIADELLINKATVNVLYKNGVFTLQDLIDLGDKAFKLVGMGEVKARDLENAMKAKNIHFNSTFIEPGKERKSIAVMPEEQVIEKLRQENLEIRNKISRKEELLSEYEKLIAERNELLEREKQLDEEITSKMAVLQTSSKKKTGKRYVRR